jgi:transposase
MVYEMQQNLLQLGSAVRPQFATAGRPRKLAQADENRVFDWLLEEGWRNQDEIVEWLDVEHSAKVYQSTVSRMLKWHKWTRKAVKCQSNRASHELRSLSLEDLAQYEPDDLVFLDESIFNEKTG